MAEGGGDVAYATVQDVQGIVDLHDANDEVRYQSLVSALQEIGSVNDGVADVVMVDDEQWSAVRADIATLSDQLSVVLYLVLVSVCVLAAILGAHLWKSLAEGWRH